MISRRFLMLLCAGACIAFSGCGQRMSSAPNPVTEHKSTVKEPVEPSNDRDLGAGKGDEVLGK